MLGRPRSVLVLSGGRSELRSESGVEVSHEGSARRSSRGRRCQKSREPVGGSGSAPDHGAVRRPVGGRRVAGGGHVGARAAPEWRPRHLRDARATFGRPPSAAGAPPPERSASGMGRRWSGPGGLLRQSLADDRGRTWQCALRPKRRASKRDPSGQSDGEVSRACGGQQRPLGRAQGARSVARGAWREWRALQRLESGLRARAAGGRLRRKPRSGTRAARACASCQGGPVALDEGRA